MNKNFSLGDTIVGKVIGFNDEFGLVQVRWTDGVETNEYPIFLEKVKEV